MKLPATIGRPGDWLADVAALEAAGVDSIWLDDLALRPATGSEAEPQLEPWTLLAAIAAVTRVTRLGTRVASVGPWTPELFAATVIALERLSGGRAVVCLGLAGELDEFAVPGLRHEDKGRRLEEFIELVRRLWSGSLDPFDGEFYKAPGIRLAHGARPQGPPILVYGGDDGDLERAARVGDGIVHPNLPPDQVAAKFARAGELRAAADRKGDFEAWVEIPIPADRAAWRLALDGYEAAGATGVIVSWDQRIVDLLRNAGVEDDRSDLLIATG